jgi:hypothetical protein
MNCVYLPSPASDGTGGYETVEEALQTIHTIPFSELRRPFQTAFDKFSYLVEDTVRLKQVKGRSMTGPVFAEFLQLTVDCINSSKIIYLQQAFAKSVETVASDTMKECWVLYRREMEKFVNTFCDERPISESALRAFESKLVGSLLTRLQKKIGPDSSEIYEDTKARFLEMKTDKFKQHLAHNAANVRVMNQSTGKEVWIERFGGLEIDFGKYRSKSEFAQEVADFKQELREEMFDCVDFEKFYGEFMLNVVRYDALKAGLESHLAKVEAARKEAEAAEAKRRVDELEKRDKDTKNAMNELIEQHKQSTKQLELEKARALTEQNEKHKKELDDLKRELSSSRLVAGFPPTPASSSTLLTPPATPVRYVDPSQSYYSSVSPPQPQSKSILKFYF